MFQVSNFKFQEKGFTLIELLVVTAITLLLIGLVLSNYRAGQSQFALQRSTYKLSQDLRRIQEMAMGSKEIGPASGKFYPDGGFGIYFDLSKPEQYILFADCNANGKYNTGPSVCAPGIPEMIDEPILLESKVEIIDISPSALPAPGHLAITFKAPDPTISINQGAATQAEITLSLSTGETKKIIVNQAGLITIE